MYRGCCKEAPVFGRTARPGGEEGQVNDEREGKAGGEKAREREREGEEREKRAAKENRSSEPHLTYVCFLQLLFGIL